MKKRPSRIHAHVHVSRSRYTRYHKRKAVPSVTENSCFSAEKVTASSSHAYRNHRSFLRNRNRRKKYIRTVSLRHVRKNAKNLRRFHTENRRIRCAVNSAHTVTAVREDRASLYGKAVFLTFLACLFYFFMITAVPGMMVPEPVIEEITLETEPVIENESEPEPTVIAAPAMNGIRDQLLEYLRDQEGEWSVYIKNLKDGTSLTLHGEQMPSASLIKLFTAGRYEEAVLNGEIYPTEFSERCEYLMLRYSDNDAWVALEEIIGHYNYSAGVVSVTEFAQNNRYSSTGRLIETEYGEENLTSARDVGAVLESLYNGTYVSQEASEKILSCLKEQYYTQKIPAGLPEGILSANKTGELEDVQNDAAIVYGEKCDYILVVMSVDGPYEEESWDIISHISSLVYQYLNS